MSSILTNNGAMVALQTMKSINKDLGSIQDMISTGKKVSNAKDNAAIWAISTVMESDVSSLKAVGDSLSLGQSTVSVARNASEQVTDILGEIKTKIVSAQEENVDRTKIQADITALRDQVKSVVGAAQFNGLNLLKGDDAVNILSSLDRSSNGSVTTSNITVERNNLDTGVAATAGTEIVESTATAIITAGLNVEAGDVAATAGERELTSFSNTQTNIEFDLTTSFDEGDSYTFQLEGNGQSLEVAYTQTAEGNANTTDAEFADQLVNAYNAYVAGNDVGTGATSQDYVESSKTFTATSGSFTFTEVGSTPDDLKALSLSASDGNVTLTNTRDYDVGLIDSGGSLGITNRADTNIANVSQAFDNNSGGTAVDFTGGGVGLQSDDSYSLVFSQETGGDTETFTINIDAPTGGLSTDEVAEIAFNALEGIKDSTYGNTDTATIGGASVSFTYDNGGGGSNESTFVADLAEVTFTNTGSGVVTIEDAAGNQDWAIAGTRSIGSASSTATGTVSDGVGAATTIGSVDGLADGTAVVGLAGTLGDSANIDIAGTVQTGDVLSVTIEGLQEPVTYSVTGNEANQDAIAVAFKDAINTQLQAAGGTLSNVVASIDGTDTSQVNIKNFDTAASPTVSEVSVTNELSGVATASDTAIAAEATETFSFKGRSVSEGDTYSISVGADSNNTTTVSYTATKYDDLNDVAKNLGGLLQINSGDDIDVAIGAATDPEDGTNNATLSITNNGTSALSSFSTTVKSGGNAGGGLNLIDSIDVTSTDKANGSLQLIDTLIQNSIDASADFGSSEKRLEIQQEFIGKLTDSLSAGIGTLVDANMEETAARLQALQVQQQLGTQALSIANQAPQNILALFR